VENDLNIPRIPFNDEVVYQFGRETASSLLTSGSEPCATSKRRSETVGFDGLAHMCTLQISTYWFSFGLLSAINGADGL
jgi:hypothetical protein